MKLKAGVENVIVMLKGAGDPKFYTVLSGGGCKNLDPWVPQFK